MPKKLLVIGYVWPEPNTTAAGCRMQQLLNAFLELGYRITFASTAVKTEYSLDLKPWGIKETTIALNHSSFDDFVKQLAPDLVMFDRFMVEEQFGWRVAEFAPNAVRILNTEDLHGLRKAREEVHKKDVRFKLLDWKNHPVTVRELASMYRCDLSLIISTFEMRILREHIKFPAELLFHLPFMVEVSKNHKDTLPTFAERNDFVSIGNGKHAPNVDAIKLLKQEIWPHIRKNLPEAQLRVYGAYLPQQIKEMHHPKSGFFIDGWVENADLVLENSRILLAPLRFGAGIKGKLLDGMKTGTPTVTTTIGAEGMYGDQHWNGVISDNWNDFANAAVKLYQNKLEWERAQKNGFALLESNYNKTKSTKQFKDLLDNLIYDLENHRTENFVGRLLQHQTLTSSKYMAKWIEEKNKKV